LRGFIEAQRLQQSLDNPTAVARNQINQARAEMALGHTDAALQRASLVVDPVSQVEALLLQAQANLALGRVAVAHTHLTMLDRICSTECPFTGSVHVLHARAALMQKRPVEALAHAESALRILLERHEPLEIANAWRLIASAQLALSDTSKALGAAQAALEIDRQLALPEKIARDWLLIGDIHRKANAPQQHESYQRALAVAQAARVTEVIRIATQALKENTP
jgi:tetratricopeptide (TPR) repeat protein